LKKSKLIIIEGPQGVGKTTITNYVRDTLPYTNLYRLCGTSDVTKCGKNKARNMYKHLLKYIKGLQGKDINLLFDRLFFTEEVYCRLGKKEYTFTHIYNKLCKELFKCKYDIYYINLYLRNTNLYTQRLNRPGKANFKNSTFNIENSIQQQHMYSSLSKELLVKYNQKVTVVNVNCDDDLNSIKCRIRNILGIGDNK